MRKELRIIHSEPLLLLALPISLISLLAIIIARPFIRIRIGFLRCDRIGHFAANTEMYMCERDYRDEGTKTVDLFYFPREVCNQQLATMWKRKLHVLPWFWLRPLCLIVRSFDCFASYRAVEARGGDFDVDNLLDRFPPHLDFTADEEARGKAGLEAMGIPDGSPFVCLIVRDSAYLDQYRQGGDHSYHNFRDSDIQNYVLAAEALADRGYYVIRMGQIVHEAIPSKHARVIDYATNGMRSDFMDVYLGAKCSFCVSTGTGWDALPYIFRRPIVYVNYMPICEMLTSRADFLTITKTHVLKESGQVLSLREIVSRGVALCGRNSDYDSKGVDFIDNTPEEIRDVVLEMADRQEGVWQPHEDDEALQRRFWQIFPTDVVKRNGAPMHGEIRSRYGADYLRKNPWWLE